MCECRALERPIDMSLGDTVAELALRRRRLAEQELRPSHLHEVTDFGPNPGALRMLIHTPDLLPARAALVVVLHGCAQTAEAYAEGAGWLTLADRYGFVVLAPQQTRSNNPNLCFNWFQSGDVARDAGEAASIHEMIGCAVADHGLDIRRVFVTGLSAGGAMANVMLAAYPETFAAGAIIAGIPYGSASNMQEAFGAMGNATRRTPEAWGDAVRAASAHAGRWPRVSIWQGDSDTTVRPGVADELVSQWLDVHGLDDAGGEEVDLGDGRRRIAWRGADGQAAVELNRIAGMAHGAPVGAAVLDGDGVDGCGTPGPYLLEVGISSSLEIAQAWGLASGGLASDGLAAKGAGARTVKTPGSKTAGAKTTRGAVADKPAPSNDEGAPVGGMWAGWGLEAGSGGEVGKVITDALRSAGLLK
jgi:poly(hydroxyalkanoate) depolymerase family esterase